MQVHSPSTVHGVHIIVSLGTIMFIKQLVDTKMEILAIKTASLELVGRNEFVCHTSYTASHTSTSVQLDNWGAQHHSLYGIFSIWYNCDNSNELPGLVLPGGLVSHKLDRGLVPSVHQPATQISLQKIFYNL